MVGLIQRGAVAALLFFVLLGNGTTAFADPSSEAVLKRITALEVRLAAVEVKSQQYRLEAEKAREELALERARVPASINHPSMPAVVASTALQSTASATQRFAGAFVSVTGGYDFSLDANTSEYGGVRGSKIGGTLGYNAVSGPLLFGFEGRGQYSFASATTTFATSSPGFQVPGLLQSLTCFGCDQSFLNNYPIPTYGPLALNYRNRTDIEHSRPWQVDFAFRTGMIVEDWLLFGKIGAGAEESRLKVTSDSTGTQYCTPIIERQRPAFNTVVIAATGCSALTTGPLTTTVATSVNPVVLIGGGVERNFGHLFARAEAELTAHLVASGAYYTPSANVAVGYRF